MEERILQGLTGTIIESVVNLDKECGQGEVIKEF